MSSLVYRRLNDYISQTNWNRNNSIKKLI